MCVFINSSFQFQKKRTLLGLETGVDRHETRFVLMPIMFIYKTPIYPMLTSNVKKYRT